MSFPENLSDRARGLIIAIAGLVLIVNCWKAPFLNYDDGSHITDNAQVMKPLNLGELFTQPSDYKFFPITILTYRLDRILFESWMPGLLGSWAPGVRTMSLLYHAGTALLVWQILLLLGVGRSAAFFSGLVFAVHPMACETVCWVSERKTALAGLFGFAALFVFLRFSEKKWRLPLAAFLYFLATLSKPSALGLFPVLCLLVWFPWRTPDAPSLQPSRNIADKILNVAPFACIAAIITWLNLGFHQRAIIPPPGGNIFTAVLTDVEILPRYLFNFLVPVRLSFVYFVDPIVSIFDARFFLYGALLAAAVAVTIRLSVNRRLSILGWLWFLAALSPTLNLVGISNLMQDRFLYLSLPGLLIVLTETSSGLAQKFEWSDQKLRPVAIAYLVALALLSVLRGGLFNDTMALFKDAVTKQPLAAHARYGYCLGLIKMVQDVNAAPGSPSEKGPVLYRLRCAMGDQDRFFIDHCPDADRQLNFSPIALRAAEYCMELSQDAPGKYTADIERYLKFASEGTPFLKPVPEVRGNALKYLANLRLNQQLPAEAFALMQESVRYFPSDPEARYLRAYAALTLLQKEPAHPRRAEILLIARTDLDSISPDMPIHKEAQELMKSPLLKNAAGN